jgi:hypothetical protein
LRHSFAVTYLVSHPHDVEGLRYLLGHLSAATYRIYIGQAGQRLSELTGGRESIAEAMESQGAHPVHREMHVLLAKRQPVDRQPTPLPALLAAVQADPNNPELRRALLRALDGAA